VPEQMNKNETRIAQALTYAGIVPFLLLSMAVVMKFNGYDCDLYLRAYGAVIVSFLCGIQWGIYLLFSEKCPRNLLLHSNMITLIVYGALLLCPSRIDLIIEALCFCFLLKLDQELMKQQIIPLWYFSLRRNATLTVVILLISTACL